MTAPSPTSYNITTMTIPRELIHVHKHVKLYIDIFYVNRLVFFATKSDGGIQYITINNMEDKHANTIIKYLNNVIKKYASRGFIIMDIFGDGEFDVEEIISSTQPATLHICPANEHVPRSKGLLGPLRNVLAPFATLFPMTPSRNFSQFH